MRSLFFIVFFSALGCSSHYARLIHPPAIRPMAKAESDRVFDDLFRSKFESAEKRVRVLLSKEPNLALAHEAAALLAELRGDRFSANQHWVAAISDGRSQMLAHYLSQIELSTLDLAKLKELAELLDDASLHHRSSYIRFIASRYAAKLFLLLGKKTKAAECRSRNFPIRKWLAISGFDNEEGRGFDTPYGPETELIANKRYLTSRGETAWRVITQDGVGDFDLRGRFYPFSANVSYLAAFFNANYTGSANLAVTTSDPIKIWINDRLTVSTQKIKTKTQMSFFVPIALQSGFNKILVKSCQNSGKWIADISVLDSEGAPLKLKLSTAQKSFKKDERELKEFNVALPQELKTMTLSKRRVFWHANYLAQLGMSDSALSLLRRHLRRADDNSLAALRLAQLLQLDKQEQAASAMVFYGMRLSQYAKPAFLIERAKLYRRRGQYDRALETLDKLVPKMKLPQYLKTQESRFFEHLRLLSSKGWQVDRWRLVKSAKKARPNWPALDASESAAANANSHPLKALNAMLRAKEMLKGKLSYRQRAAHLLMEFGKCDDALNIYRKTVVLYPDNGWAKLAYAKTLDQCNHTEEAFKLLHQLAKQIPAWGKPYRHLGRSYYALGDVKNALTYWKKALKLDPNDSKLWDRIESLSPDKDSVLKEIEVKPQDILSAIQSARRVKPMPGASIIWLLDHEAARLMPDGTLKRVVTIVKKAVDTSGRDRLGEVRLPRSGLVKVVDAYALDKRGRRVEVTSMHGRRVRYPKLSVGAIIVLKYRHIQRPSGYLRTHMAASWYFQHPLAQVRHAQWALAIPKDRKLNFEMSKGIAHQVANEQGVVKHFFSAENVPPLRPEQRSLPARDLLRSVTVSTIPNWDYFSSWGKSLTHEVFEITPQLEEKLKEVVKGADSVEAKIRKVYAFALEEIRYQQDYETFIAGVKPHRASVVLARGYGDCKDKTVLMIAMLRHLGIKAEFAMVRTQRAGKVKKSVPSQQFNHAIVYLPKQNGVKNARFLDATAESLDIDTLRSDDQGTTAFVLAQKGYQLIEIPYQSEKENHANISIALALKQSGDATGQITLRFVGHQAGMLRKPLQNSQIVRQYGQQVIHRIYPGGQLKDIRVFNQDTVLKPLIVQIQADFNGAASLDKDRLRMRIPEILSWSSSATWSERKHPVFYGPPSAVKVDFSLKLFEGANHVKLPQHFSIQGKCFAVKGGWRYDRKTLSAEYQQETLRKCPIIKASDYSNFKEKVDGLEREIRKEIEFRLPKSKKKR